MRCLVLGLIGIIKLQPISILKNVLFLGIRIDNFPFFQRKLTQVIALELIIHEAELMMMLG